MPVALPEPDGEREGVPLWLCPNCDRFKPLEDYGWKNEVYFGYGSGCLRVSLGHNWESGGTLFSAVEDPIWLFPEHATLVAGNKILLDGGRLVE